MVSQKPAAHPLTQQPLVNLEMPAVTHQAGLLCVKQVFVTSKMAIRLGQTKPTIPPAANVHKSVPPMLIVVLGPPVRISLTGLAEQTVSKSASKTRFFFVFLFFKPTYDLFFVGFLLFWNKILYSFIAAHQLKACIH